MSWILNRTLYRPINKIIESREKNKGGYFGEAAEILKSVDEKEAHYSQEMLDARSKGYALLCAEAVGIGYRSLGKTSAGSADRVAGS